MSTVIHRIPNPTKPGQVFEVHRHGSHVHVNIIDGMEHVGIPMPNVTGQQFALALLAASIDPVPSGT